MINLWESRCILAFVPWESNTHVSIVKSNTYTFKIIIIMAGMAVFFNWLAIEERRRWPEF